MVECVRLVGAYPMREVEGVIHTDRISVRLDGEEICILPSLELEDVEKGFNILLAKEREG